MGACVLCKEQITNPLSPQRLTEQVTTWLGETRPVLATAFQDEVKNNLSYNNTLGNDFCVVTGTKMTLCAYCFTEHIFHWLVDQDVASELMHDYVTFFNYDVTGKGYRQDARDKGYLE
jgi:hypothetical protein